MSGQANTLPSGFAPYFKGRFLDYKITVKRSDIITLIQNAIAGGGNAGDRLKTEDIDQSVRAALISLQRTRPLYKDAQITLISGASHYDTPADFIDYSYSDWGTRKRSYEHGCGVRPHLFKRNHQLAFSPAPSDKQLSVWGREFDYVYHAKHVLDDDETKTTLDDADEPLLLLRAMAELMRILTTRNVVDPIQLHSGLGNIPTSGTPQAIYEALMNEYRLQVTER